MALSTMVVLVPQLLVDLLHPRWRRRALRMKSQTMSIITATAISLNGKLANAFRRHQHLVNEDIDGDGNLDLFNEDVNRNGTLDTDLPNRNFVASLDADGDLQDIDFLVENDLFVNGEKVLVESRTLAARGSEGIEGVIEKRADGTIQLGENSFLFDEATDTISTSSGDINLDADVDITGDLTIAGLTGDVASRINNNSSRIESNQENIEQNTRGIAMVAALQHTTVLPGMTNAFDLSAAYFEGETGLALNFARRLSDNVQINFGAASTTDFDESVIKAGIGVQW